jgi:type I restriction enzyme S subunit
MMSSSIQIRTYKRSQSAVFFRTKEAFGGLSNMASGFPLRVNGVHIHTSEALYQACRFPHLPNIQQKIIAEHSPMTAKMKSKPHRSQSRPDWDSVRTKIMRWCLRVKLVQNWKSFGDLLLATGDRPIVEQSRKDEFWGAKEIEDGTLTGMNVLGRLLMELREELRSDQIDDLKIVRPLPITDFVLYGRAIEPVSANGTIDRSSTVITVTPPSTTISDFAEQASLFNARVAYSQPPDILKNAGTAGSLALVKPYPHYKSSGISWLNRVPEHWKIRPGLAAFREQFVKNVGMQEKQVLSLSYGRIIVKSEDKLRGLVPDSFSTYQIVDPGDIIVRSTDLQNDKTSIRIGFVRNRGIITSAYICIRTADAVIPGYGYQLLNSYDLMKVLYGMGSGLRQNLEWADFKRMPIVLPPRDEQVAITRYLGNATREIDKAIHAKRRLIALLNEQKRAIISDTIKHGLTPKATLKDSGLRWLGRIPSHWELRPLKRLLLRMDYGTSANVRGDGKVRVLTMAHIQDGKVVIPEHGGLDAVPKGLLLEANDLLFNRTNSPELVGKVGLYVGTSSDEVTFASYLVRLRARSEVNSRWLNYLLNSIAFWGYARSHALVSLQQANLNSTRYGQMIVPVPPKSEQDEIVQLIATETAGIEKSISITGRQINLLREYRTRLIADVVTGKLDVRAAAAQLPDDEREPLDVNPADEGEAIEEEEGAFAEAANV